MAPPPIPLGTYDPLEQDLIFNGVQISGWAEGSMIKAMRNEPLWTFKASNSGGGARCRNPNKSGRVEVTLHQGSPSNGVLSTFVQADELTAEGVGELLIKDRSTGTAKCSAQNAWIVQHPDYERAKETGELTWVFETDELLIAHDGLSPI
jgi:hypothetical protein